MTVSVGKQIAEGPELERHMTRYVMELLDPRRITERKSESVATGGSEPACGAQYDNQYWLWTSADIRSILDSGIGSWTRFVNDDPERWPNWPTCWICSAILGEIVANIEPGTTESMLIVRWLDLSKKHIDSFKVPKVPIDERPPDVTDDIF